MLKITSSFRTAAIAVAIGSFTLAIPLYVATAADSDQTQSDQNNTASAQSAKGSVNVENRIQTLHDKLKITADQEDAWVKVAQTMRDNETNIHQLIRERHAHPDSMTAIDDLQSYQKIAQAHADGLQKLTTVFQDLYNSMSDDQKRNADEVFGRFEGHRDAITGKKKHK